LLRLNFRLEVMESMYGILVKIDDTLPWIELKKTYTTRVEAAKAAKEAMKRIETKIAYIPEQQKPMKALVAVRATR
jgi:hypothetical protein